MRLFAIPFLLTISCLSSSIAADKSKIIYCPEPSEFESKIKNPDLNLSLGYSGTSENGLEYVAFHWKTNETSKLVGVKILSEKVNGSEITYLKCVYSNFLLKITLPNNKYSLSNEILNQKTVPHFFGDLSPCTDPKDCPITIEPLSD